MKCALHPWKPGHQPNCPHLAAVGYLTMGECGATVRAQCLTVRDILRQAEVTCANAKVEAHRVSLETICPAEEAYEKAMKEADEVYWQTLENEGLLSDGKKPPWHHLKRH